MLSYHVMVTTNADASVKLYAREMKRYQNLQKPLIHKTSSTYVVPQQVESQHYRFY